jgi:hypothetical protein
MSEPIKPALTPEEWAAVPRLHCKRFEWSQAAGVLG